ncbi:MAG: hypothetical protein ACRC35_07730 [Angustibacter sp.]
MAEHEQVPDYVPQALDRSAQDRILAVLREEGYRPSVDEEGFIEVKAQGRRTYVRCVEDAVGPNDVVRVSISWSLDETSDLAVILARLQACNDISDREWLVKLSLVRGGNTLICAIEQVVQPQTTLAPLLVSSFDAVLRASTLWFEAGHS